MRSALSFNRILFFGALLATIAIPVLLAAQSNSSGAAPAANGKHAVRQSPAATKSEGELLFQRNCARCHAAPDGFSPRISGTIVRHMRVRANLSEHDERELLRFFNP